MDTDKLLQLLRERNERELPEPLTTLIIQNQRYRNSSGGTVDGASSGEGSKDHARLIQDYETRITDLKSELSSLQATHRKVLEEENATMKEAQSARRAKEAAEEKLQATQQRLSSSETENNELKQKLARLEEEVELLRKELSESLEIRKKLNADLEKEQSEVNSLASRILNEKQNTMMQMNEMSEMNASLQERWKKAQTQIAALQTQLDKMRKGGGGGSESKGVEDDREEPTGGDDDDDGFVVLGSSKVPTSVAFKLDGHSSEINDLKFDATGSILASASSDGIIKLWDARRGTEHANLRLSCAALSVDLSRSPKGLIVAGGYNDKFARLWDVETGRVRCQLAGHNGQVYGVQFTPDGRFLVTCSSDRSVRLWDVNSKNCIRVIPTTSAIYSAAVSSDGGFVVTGHHDHGVRLYDLRKGSKICETRDLHSNKITSVSFSKGDSSRSILTMSMNGTLRVVSARTLRPFDDIVMTAKEFKPANFWSNASGSARMVYAAAGGNEGVHVWDTMTGELHSTLQGPHKHKITTVDWHDGSSGSLLASGDKDGLIAIWA